MLRSRETGKHVERTARIALRLGREMNLSDDLLHTINYAALLHDIGKLAVPDAILHKCEMPTADEWTILREHPWRGENLISELGFPERICSAVGQHHERWSGAGYPRRLRGTSITIEARVIAVADAFDCITQDRCYKRGESYEVALNEIVGASGICFDPHVVEAFRRIPKDELLLQNSSAT